MDEQELGEIEARYKMAAYAPHNIFTPDADGRLIQGTTADLCLPDVPRLVAAVRALTAENARLAEAVAELQTERGRLAAERDAAQDDAERLRGALQTIANVDSQEWVVGIKSQQIARAALGPA